MTPRRWLIVLAFLPMHIMAQTSHRDSVRQVVRERMLTIDSVMGERYNRITFDTLYIRRPQSRLTFKVRGNVSGTSISSEGSRNGNEIGSDVSTDHKATLSFGVNYRGLTAGFALNPASLSGRSKDYEMNINAYSNRYGFDVVYQTSQTLSGTVTLGGVDRTLDKGIFTMKMVTITGYYAFNGRRFSYPAAFSQSYIQRRSAGSWLVGLSYLGGSIKADNEAIGNNSYRVYIGYFGLGGGYGYNLVLGQKWLIHLSALPTLVVSNYSNVKINGERLDMATKFPNIILAERGAVVYNFSDKYFAGLTMVMTNSLLGSRTIDINYRKWRARMFFGFRL